MSKKPMFKMAVSTIVLGAALVSCSATGGGKPASLSAHAEKALQKGDPVKALVKAEEAVALDPRNASLRRLLAESYLANGRLLSAEQSFADALELGDTSARTVISLALMHAAQGDNNRAQRLLNEYRQNIPATDYGLAVALSGNSKSGVETLIQEIRDGNNSAKLRQNLALAYALDGRWREAQIMVGQDLDPTTAQARITEWARIAHPQAHQEKIASVLGVTPVADNGQPVQLALANNPSMAAMVEAVAAQEPVKPSVTPVAPLAPLIRAEATPVRTVPVPASASSRVASPAPTAPETRQAPEAPVRTAATSTVSATVNGVKYVTREIVQTLPDDYRSAKRVRVASAAEVEPSILRSALEPIAERAPVSAPAKFKPVSGGSFAVQLGVFSSTANANRAWQHYTARHSDLAAFSRANASVSARGRNLHRLRANGFADEKTARAMCAKIRSAGDECIIARVGK